MSDGEDTTKRTAVKTYVPAYQKETWRRHAEELGMTQSEFVRTMVQAGRKGFEFDAPEQAAPGADPRGHDLEDAVLEALSKHDHLSWEHLVERIAGNFESELEDTLQRLQNENRVQYSGRRGGYTVIE